MYRCTTCFLQFERQRTFTIKDKRDKNKMQTGTD